MKECVLESKKPAPEDNPRRRTTRAGGVRTARSPKPHAATGKACRAEQPRTYSFAIDPADSGLDLRLFGVIMDLTRIAWDSRKRGFDA